ncbi:MAG: hypothetical protein JO255_23150 [Alphaproteobacteria bacterium]|nr:hypothetical protein [Alphaproteobacteria bacterium]
MKKRLLSLALLLAVSACSTSPAPLVARIKTIGVVSAVGDTVAYQRVGAVPSHSETTWGDTSWQLDDYVVETVKAKLASRYTVTPVDADPVSLRRPRDADDALAFERGPSVTQRLRAALKPGTPPVDAYLVVAAESDKDFIGGTNHRLTGLAIYRRAGSGLQVYAVCDLFLIDAHSFKIIASAPLRLERDRMFGGAVSTTERPYRTLDRSLQRDTRWDQFTEADRIVIDVAFKNLLRDSLGYTVQDMKLAP